ncbi:MAG: hypothetical protein AAGK04_03475 [Planctomycetota bacterium]
MNAPRPRRGLAMPMVLLLVLVAGVLLTVTLQRESAHTRSVARRLQAYQDVHAQRGLQEIIEMWLSTYASGGVEAALEPDGRAFDLELADASTVRVFLQPAQGSARLELGGLGRTSRNRAEGVLEALAETLGSPDRFADLDARGRPYTRPVGPVAISVAHAPQAVLLAASQYAVRDARRAETVVDALVRARESGELEEEAVQQAAADISAEQAERVLLQRVLTTRPELWWCRVELRGVEAGRSRAIASVYGGYLQASVEGVPPDDTEGPASQGRGSFLTWDRLDPEAPSPAGPMEGLQSRGGTRTRARVQ